MAEENGLAWLAQGTAFCPICGSIILPELYPIKLVDGGRIVDTNGADVVHAWCVDAFVET